MQISRLFQIIYILLEKGSITAPDLAERFEVSVRTIYRDIDALSQAGIPIYASQGKGGGISLTDNFILNKSLLSEKEQDEILLALQSLSAVRYPEINEVLIKLGSLFKKSEVSWIEVDFSPWGSDVSQKEEFNLIKEAILKQHVILFSYFNNTGVKSERYVEPKKLLFKDKSWYLMGYCLQRRSCRTFKISRMSGIHITEDTCTHSDTQDDLSGNSKDDTSLTIPLKLKISENGAYRVYEDFNEKDVTKKEDGSYFVDVHLPVGEWIYNFLFSYGPLLEVVEPQNVRLEMINRIENMLRNYKTTTNVNPHV